MNKLTPTEETAMMAVWKSKGGIVKDILEQYPDTKIPYTTLASTLKNLEKKGFITSRKYGNVYAYSPGISEEEYAKKTLSGLVKNHFENSFKELVTFFAKEEKISSSELKEIIDLIEKNKS
jgi:predicted transcriptional regulator